MIIFISSLLLLILLLLLPLARSVPSVTKEIESKIGLFVVGNQKENKVYIGKKKVMKVFAIDFERNEGRATTASRYNYGPYVYETGRLANGKGFIIFERLHPVLHVDELRQNADSGFIQLQSALTRMHEIGGHTHGDIHLGNIMYQLDSRGNKKFIWNDFDLGVQTARTKARRRLDLKLEIDQLWDIRKRVIVPV